LLKNPKPPASERVSAFSFQSNRAGFSIIKN
jgi:hypothetical protein